MRCIYCDSKELKITNNICYCMNCHKSMVKLKAVKYGSLLNKSIKNIRVELSKGIKNHNKRQIITAAKQILKIIPNDIVAFVYYEVLTKDRFSDKYTKFLNKLPLFSTKEEVMEVIDTIINNAYFCERKPILNIISKMNLDKTFIDRLNNKIYNLGKKTLMDNLYPKCFSLNKSEGCETEMLSSYIFLAEYLNYYGNDVHDDNINKNQDVTCIVNKCEEQADYKENIDKLVYKRKDDFLKGLVACDDLAFQLIDSNIVTFGMYPQTIKESYVEVTKTDDGYIGSDGAKYVKRKCVLSDYKFTPRFSDGGECTSEEEYFRIEPIKWQIVDYNEDKICLLSQDIIDIEVYSHNFKDNFSDSTLQKFLNEYFLNTAFTSKQKRIIEGSIKLVNNEVFDNIKKRYGINKIRDILYKRITDYAISKEINVYTKDYWVDCGKCNILFNGLIRVSGINQDKRGVVPMLWINIREK